MQATDSGPVMRHNPMRTAMIMTTMLAMTAGAYMVDGIPELAGPPGPRPPGYGVHLSKAERRGKSFAELQAMRAERIHAQ
ncbi:MAG: hypothetical protein IMZ69_07345 [Spirochaetes bacterium]|nr:hypothetical protein [Spirochaetota bacterium]